MCITRPVSQSKPCTLNSLVKLNVTAIPSGCTIALRVPAARAGAGALYPFTRCPND